MTQREQTLVGATLAFGLPALALWAVVRLGNARDAAAAAAADLAECRSLAARIDARHLAGTIAAGTHEPQDSELTGRIMSAARTAEFPESAIERIEPLPAQRVGNGGENLLEKPIVVNLRGVTLQQLFTFFHAVGGGRSNLQLRQIRLFAPGDDTGDRWSVDSTLAYFVDDIDKAPAEQARLPE